MAAANALAFGAGAAVLPLFDIRQNYLWMNNIDKSVQKLLRDIELPRSDRLAYDMAYQLAHDVLALTTAVLTGNEIAGVVTYDKLSIIEKRNFSAKWNQWLQTQHFVEAPHITAAKAMWPAAAAGLFAGYTLNTGMTLYGALRAPDIYMHFLVTDYKHCLIAWRSKEQNSDLLACAGRLAAYAYIWRSQPRTENMLGIYSKVFQCNNFTEAFRTILNLQTEDYV